MEIENDRDKINKLLAIYAPEEGDENAKIKKKKKLDISSIVKSESPPSSHIKEISSSKDNGKSKKKEKSTTTPRTLTKDNSDSETRSNKK